MTTRTTAVRIALALFVVAVTLAVFSGVVLAGESWLAVGVSPAQLDAGVLRPGETKSLVLNVVGLGDVPHVAEVSVEGSRWSGVRWPEGAEPAPPTWLGCEPSKLSFQKKGEVKPTTVTLRVPDGAPPGKYAFLVAVRAWPGGEGIRVSTISFSLVEFEVEGTPLFRDVVGHWAQNDIAWLYSRGIVRGYPDGTFKPDEPITRLESVLFVARALGLTQGAESVLEKFADAGEIPAWARSTAGAATSGGLVAGDLTPSGLLFAPNRGVTRTEAALFVLRAAFPEVKPPASGGPTFADAAHIPEWARVDLVRAAAAGIVKGYPDGTLRPGAAVTRAEVAVMLARALKTMPAR